MEDATIVMSCFFDVPLWIVAGDAAVNSLDRASFCFPSHFFGIHDGHIGSSWVRACTWIA